MKNLKKVLALVLAFACAFTMFAGAAFTDAADIADNNVEAVEMLNSLGVIGGYTDGSFRPDKTITRAEMAKMIFTIRNGGNSDASAYTSVSTSFTDISGHWAEGYIKYCQVNGIISGKSATRFDPEGQVTVVETAKMALVLMGYNASADRANLVGTGWDSRTLSLATDNSLLDDVSGSVTSPIIRGEAAQLLFNAIDADCVVWSNDVETFIKDQVTVGTTTTTWTVGTKYLGLQEWIGTFTGNYDTDAAAKEGYIAVNGENAADATVNGVATFPYDLDLWENIGEEVKVLFKDGKGGTADTPDDKDVIYGVYNTGATTVYTATKNDIEDQKSSDAKIKIDGTKYDTANNVTVVTNHIGSGVSKKANDGTSTTNSELTTALKAVNGDTIKFVCNDDDKIVTAYVTESKIGYVTAVNNEKVTINGLGAITIADNDIYEGIAKNDIVVTTTYYNAKATDEDAYTVVEKAEVVTGEIEGYTANVANTSSKKVVVDGTTYSVYNEAAMGTTVADETGVAYFGDGDIGDTFDLYLVNGFVGYAVLASDDANEYALVVDLNDGVLGSTFNAPKVELLLADNTKVTVELHEDSVIWKEANHATGTTPIGANDKINATNCLEKGSLVKYSVVSDDVYKIEEIGTYAQGNGSTVQYDKDTKTFAGTVTSGSCPLFVYNDATAEYTAYSIRNLGDIVVPNTQDYAYYIKDGSVVAAYANLDNRPAGSSANMFYGIVASEDGVVKIDGEFYNKYTVSNNTGSQIVYLPTSDTQIAKGDIVGFDITSDNVYADTLIDVYTGTAYDATNGLATYAKSYSESDQTLTYWQSITGNATTGYIGTANSEKTVALDDDVQIVYVNANDVAAGDEIGVNSFDGVTGYRNILLVKDSTNSKCVAVIVESSQDADILGYSGYTIKVNGTTYTYPVGYNVTVANLNLPTTYTVTDTAGTNGADGNNGLANGPADWTGNGNAPVSFTMPAFHLTIVGTGYTIAAPTTKGSISVNGVTQVANNSTETSADYGESVVVKFTTTGDVDAGDGVTVTATITFDDSTTTTVSKVLAGGTTAGNFETSAFTMPGQNVASITFDVTAN